MAVPRSPLTPAQIGLLMFSMACAWGGVARGSFQYDDFANILNDAATTDPAVLAERLLGGIRPLTRLSYAICAQLFGEWAWDPLESTCRHASLSIL